MMKCGLFDLLLQCFPLIVIVYYAVWMICFYSFSILYAVLVITLSDDNV